MNKMAKLNVPFVDVFTHQFSIHIDFFADYSFLSLVSKNRRNFTVLLIITRYPASPESNSALGQDFFFRYDFNGYGVGF